jgi:ADP-ribose pyrophosphatase YjhB (NUDIX family)
MAARASGRIAGRPPRRASEGASAGASAPAAAPPAAAAGSLRRHCAACGAPLAPAPRGTHPRCAACGTVAWRNPLPVALTLLTQGDGLVLIRRRLPPLGGHWAPPAGYVECGESVPDAARREAREETGLQVALDGLHGVYSHADVDVLIVAYRAQVQGGVARAGDDATEIGIFPAGALPPAGAAPHGPALDRWFHGLIGELTAPWREPLTMRRSATR